MSTDPEDVLRVQPPYGPLAWLLRNRDKVAAGTPGKLIPNDLAIITGRGIARQWQLVAGLPVDHGTVADEAAMLALHVDSSETAYPRWVVPGDSCLRTDDPGWRWHCVAGHGQALSDWERRPLAPTIEAIASAADGAAETAAWGSITGEITEQRDLTDALAGKADTDDVAAPLNDNAEAGGESLVVSGTGGTLRRLVAGTGITLVAAAGTITINAEVSGEQPLGIVSEMMDYGTGTITSTDGGLGWSALGSFPANDHRHTSEVMDYGTGTITTTTGGTGWSGAGTFTTLE